MYWRKNYRKRDEEGSVFLVHKTGEAVRVKLDLTKNYIKSLQSGGISFLRKIGWDIAKKENRKRKAWKDLKRERLFGSGKKNKIRKSI
tara:strand:+ start:428 stop:691 length:264 start_codon:yes stop_codon:yes gene_type:complete